MSVDVSEERPGWIDFTEAGRRLGIDRTAVRRLVRAGRLVTRTGLSTNRTVLASDVDRLALESVRIPRLED